MSGGALRRGAILFLLVAGPLAFGGVYPAVYVPLLALAAVAGVSSWRRGHSSRRLGVAVPRVPARGFLLTLHVLVLFQLVPWPPAILAILSPSSLAFRSDVALAPVTQWLPISLSPGDTLRGLVFLAGATLVYATAFREFGERGHRRQLMLAVAATGLLVTLVALVQAIAHTRRIYGVWEPRYESSFVFGPYVNKNHFAGLLVMATPVALGLLLEAADELRRRWSHRRQGWVELRGAVGRRVIGLFALVVVVVAGLFAARSRAAVGALCGALAVMGKSLSTSTRGRWLAVLAGTAAAAGFLWLGPDIVAETFRRRGIWGGRAELWQDVLHMVIRFPLFGIGLNAFGVAYPRFQTQYRSVWFGEAHNEYLQAAVDLGLPGLLVVGGLVVMLLRADPGSRPATAGVRAAIVGCCLHNLVDFTWQIPANALTFAALCGVLLRATSRGRRGNPHTAPAPRLVESAVE